MHANTKVAGAQHGGSSLRVVGLPSFCNARRVARLSVCCASVHRPQCIQIPSAAMWTQHSASVP
eukprot:12116323-Alexandrium_andersonii.AAC.1